MEEEIVMDGDEMKRRRVNERNTIKEIQKSEKRRRSRRRRRRKSVNGEIKSRM